jgi:hypothetical protein
MPKSKEEGQMPGREDPTKTMLPLSSKERPLLRSRLACVDTCSMEIALMETFVNLLTAKKKSGTLICQLTSIWKFSSCLVIKGSSFGRLRGTKYR